MGEVKNQKDGKMKSFNGDLELKKHFVNQMKRHAETDSLIQGRGWENGKGCFIGCSIEEYSHTRWADQTKLPEWLGLLADKIFEGLKPADAQTFAQEFYPAVPEGVDLTSVRHDFLAGTLAGLKVEDKYTDVNDSVNTCIAYHLDHDHVTEEQWSAAHSAADSAAYSAAHSAAYSADSADSAALSAARSAAQWAARSAAYSADSADLEAHLEAYSAADSAAHSAADSAAYSAAHSAADSAAYSAAHSAADSAAYSAAHSAAYSAHPAHPAHLEAHLEARSAAYKDMADLLIDLLKGAANE